MPYGDQADLVANTLAREEGNLRGAFSVLTLVGAAALTAAIRHRKKSAEA